MELIRARDFAKVREKFIEVIAKTPDMKKYARWDYGLHPTDEMIQGYMDRGEMFMYMEGDRIAGMAAITMYQGEDYRDISWDISLDNNQVLVIHILAVSPDYQGKGIAKKMLKEFVELAVNSGKKAVRLDALESNKPAHQLYESLGFLLKGKRKLYAENTGWTDFRFYELVL